jgi:hypothetical protein
VTKRVGCGIAEASLHLIKTEVVDIMRTLYNLLHFAKRTPKRLSISIPAHEPDLNKQEGLVLSISSEDTSQSFALSSAEISEFIVALSYAREMLQWRRIAAINAKYSEVKNRM